MIVLIKTKKPGVSYSVIRSCVLRLGAIWSSNVEVGDPAVSVVKI